MEKHIDLQSDSGRAGLHRLALGRTDCVAGIRPGRVPRVDRCARRMGAGRDGRRGRAPVSQPQDNGVNSFFHLFKIIILYKLILHFLFSFSNKI